MGWREWELPRPKPPVYSRKVTGPIESVNDWDLVSVEGELLLPIVTLENVKHGRANDVDVRILAYKQYVRGFEWKNHETRKYVERNIRHMLADEFLKHYSIPMRAEVQFHNLTPPPWSVDATDQ